MNRGSGNFENEKKTTIQLLENRSMGYLWSSEHLELFPDFAGDLVCNRGQIASFLSASFTPLCKDKSNRWEIVVRTAVYCSVVVWPA